jgi:hypothetical protein
MANMAQAIRMALHYGEKNLGLEHIFLRRRGSTTWGRIYRDPRADQVLELAAR